MSSSGHIIVTPRLELRPFDEGFLTHRYVDWLNDKEVMRYSEQRHRKHTLETCRTYYDSFEGTPHILWAISCKIDNLGHIGNATACIDARYAVADVGILIGEREIWGRGLGMEAWMGICDYLLRERKLRKVTAGAISTNSRMLRLMRKAGMKEDGVRRKQYLWEQQEVDVCHFALFAEEWCQAYPNGPFEL